MTGRKVVTAVAVILLATAVLPPAVASAVNRRRVARAAQDVAAYAARVRTQSPTDGVRCGDGRMPVADTAPVRAWITPARDPGVRPDPWGNCYFISADWVLSAGPNGIVDTPFGADATTADDIGVRLR